MEDRSALDLRTTNKRNTLDCHCSPTGRVILNAEKHWVVFPIKPVQIIIAGGVVVCTVPGERHLSNGVSLSSWDHCWVIYLQLMVGLGLSTSRLH